MQLPPDSDGMDKRVLCALYDCDLGTAIQAQAGGAAGMGAAAEQMEDEERPSGSLIPNNAISSAAHQAVSEKVPK